MFPTRKYRFYQFSLVLYQLNNTIAYLNHFVQILEGPVSVMFPTALHQGALLSKDDVVTAILNVKLDSHGAVVPLQLGLWLDEELAPFYQDSSMGDTIDKSPIEAHCDSSSLLIDNVLMPSSPDRLLTLSLNPNISTSIFWNYTLEIDGMYHFGLVNCASKRLIKAEGNVWWEGSTYDQKGKRHALPATILGIVPFYGVLSGIYLIVSIIWCIRVVNFWQYTITLQLTVFVALLANLIYCTLAFGYYLHIDVDTDVTAQQVILFLCAHFSKFTKQ